MYESHTDAGKQEKLTSLSGLICKLAVIPEEYLTQENASAVIEYLCDIEYDLIRQLNQEAPQRKATNITVLKCR
jgi:hypothetical protein